MSEEPGTFSAPPQFSADPAAATPAPRTAGKRRWLLIGAAVVVVAAAGGTAAALAGGDSFHPVMPDCTKVGAALPGHPALAEQYRTDGTDTTAGIPPVHVHSLACEGDGARVSIDILDSGEYDPITMKQYADKAVHDGSSRARLLFAEQTRGLTAASSSQAYGSLNYGGSDCSTTAVKKNVLVTVTIKGTGTTPDERLAACRTDGAKQMSAALKAVG